MFIPKKVSLLKYVKRSIPNYFMLLFSNNAATPSDIVFFNKAINKEFVIYYYKFKKVLNKLTESMHHKQL